VNYTYDPNMTVVTTDGTGLDTLDFHLGQQQDDPSLRRPRQEKVTLEKRQLGFRHQDLQSRMTTYTTPSQPMSTAMGTLGHLPGNLVDTSQTTVATPRGEGKGASQNQS
jgi:hypothetical protein